MFEFLVFWIVCGLAAGIIAGNRGGSSCLGVIAGFLLGPIGVLVAFSMGGEKARERRALKLGEKKECPKCAEVVQGAAVVCKHCGHTFPLSSFET